MKYVFKQNPWQLSSFFLLTTFLDGLVVSNAFVVQLIINSATENSNHTLSYSLLVLVVVGFLLIQAFFYYLQQFGAAYLGKKAVAIYRNLVFKRLTEEDLAVLERQESGNYLALMTSQMDNLGQNYFGAIFWGFCLFMQCLLACITAFFINSVMATGIILLSLPNVFLPIIFRKVLEKAKMRVVASTNDYVAQLNDFFGGLVDWKVNQAETVVASQEQRANERLLKQERAEAKVDSQIGVLNKSFSDYLYFGTWLLGAFLIMQKALSMGQLVAFAQLISSISYPLYAFSDIFAQIIGGKKLFASIEQQYRDKKSNQKKAIITQPFSSFEVQNVSVAFGTHHVFENLNLTLLPKKNYLICGRSGSGKTTFIKLLTKRLNEYSGTILYNGTNLRNLPEGIIYHQIAYLPQESHLFNATLAENLTLFQNYSVAELIAVLEFVELGKWANSESLAMMIGKKNKQVSGGEAKRIELARLLLQKKDVLILDEFSSGIDKETLSKIEAKLFALPVTILYVSHVYDEKLVANVDEIIDF